MSLTRCVSAQGAPSLAVACPSTSPSSHRLHLYEVSTRRAKDRIWGIRIGGVTQDRSACAFVGNHFSCCLAGPCDPHPVGERAVALRQGARHGLMIDAQIGWMAMAMRSGGADCASGVQRQITSADEISTEFKTRIGSPPDLRNGAALLWLGTPGNAFLRHAPEIALRSTQRLANRQALLVADGSFPASISASRTTAFGRNEAVPCSRRFQATRL